MKAGRGLYFRCEVGDAKTLRGPCLFRDPCCACVIGVLSVTHHLWHRHAQKSMPGSHLSALVRSVGGLLTRTSCVCLSGVGSSYLSRERHRNGVSNEPLTVTLNSGPFQRELGDSCCQESIAVAVAGWERIRERHPASPVATS